MKIRCWVCHRLKEPSTWAALSVPFATWGSQMPEPYNYYIFSIAAVCGILAIILKEGNNAVDSDTKEVLVGDSRNNGAGNGKPLAGKGKPTGRSKGRAL